jgi:predicted ABC-type ATPase
MLKKENDVPNLIIIAGCNGSGKSTTAPALLRHSLHIDEFVNADTIAQGLCAFQPEKAAIQAGRVMLERIHFLAKNDFNFAFETTLASRTFAPWINQLKKQGYQFHLVFLWLKNADLAVSRVNERVKNGGHSVPTETIIRRYTAGLKNFFNLYRPLTDSWQMHDNSNSEQLKLIASETNNNNHRKLIIENTTLWNQLLEKYHG